MKRHATLALLALMLSACGPVAFQFSAPAEYIPVYSLQNASESRLKLGGRQYVVSHLEAIFGPLSDAQKKLVMDQATLIGGKEDFYENYSTALVSAESNPIDMSARQALLIRVCHQVVQDDARTQAAVGNILGISGSAVTTKFASGPASSREIEAAYAAFFPGRSASSEVLRSLGALVSEAPSGRDAWRFLLGTLCLDPSWQLL